MPPLPQLDGLTFRMFQGESDYPHFARIVNAFSKGEESDRVETAEGIAAGYAHLERCDPARDLVVAEASGTPVAYARVYWNDEVGGPRLYQQICFVDPEYGRRGLGTALWAWSEQRLREISGEHEGDDVPQKMFEVFANDRNAGLTALARGAGFEPITYSAQMVRPSVDDLPDRPLPDGVELRPVTDDQLREIWEADTEAFRDHWGFVEPTEEAYAHFLEFPYHDPTLWKVAWDDEGVAGQVRSFIDTAQNEENGYRRG
jgi:mycothiol synthase